MIKRRFYNLEHRDGNEASSASSLSDSSASDSETAVTEAKHTGSPHSGQESGDSSISELPDADCTAREECSPSSADMRGNLALDQEAHCAADVQADIADFPPHIFLLKSVYRCRICPKVICLNEGTVKAHINSKKHARSEKLLNENKLREMLNSRGEIENQETPAELHARILAIAGDGPKKKKKWQSVIPTEKVNVKGKKRSDFSTENVGGRKKKKERQSDYSSENVGETKEKRMRESDSSTEQARKKKKNQKGPSDGLTDYIDEKKKPTKRKSDGSTQNVYEKKKEQKKPSDCSTKEYVDTKNRQSVSSIEKDRKQNQCR